MKQLRRHLKHWLVAHKHNDHRPHLVRRSGLLAAAAVIGALQLGSFVTHPAAHGAVLAYATDINTSNLLTLTNQQRANNGLPALKYDSRLGTSSSMKAADMFQYDYWAHVSPSGVQPWYWFGQAGYNYQYAGENLAKDFDTTAGVMDGWMNSPGHRANILNPNYVDVGFAVVNGTLQGEQTTLVVAHYGAPSGVHIAATVPAATPRPTVAKVVAPIGAPAPTAPVATPVPTAAVAPQPTPASSPVAAVGQITAAPTTAAYRPIAPLAVARSANTATLGTIAVLLLLLVVYLQTHFIVWRKGLKRWRRLHYRLWAGGQVAGLVGLISFLAVQGFGRVG